MADAEIRPKIIDTIGTGLKNALNAEIIKIQMQAHKDLQNVLRNTIREMGFEFEYKETSTLEKDLLATITFNFPLNLGSKKPLH